MANPEWMLTDRVLLEEEKELAPLWRGLCLDMLNLLAPEQGDPSTLAKVTAVQMARAQWEMLREVCDGPTFGPQIQAYMGDEDLFPVARQRLLERAQERAVMNTLHMEHQQALLSLFEQFRTLRDGVKARDSAQQPEIRRLVPLKGGKS